MQEEEAAPAAENQDPESRALRERTAAARARRDAVEQERQERVKKDELRAQAEAEELAAANDELIAKAELELGERGVKFATVDSPKGVIIIKPCNPLKYRQFQDAGKFHSVALEGLVFQCRWAPDHGRVDEILKEFPGLLAPCADAIAELAKGTRKESEGKS